MGLDDKIRNAADKAVGSAKEKVGDAADKLKGVVGKDDDKA